MNPRVITELRRRDRYRFRVRINRYRAKTRAGVAPVRYRVEGDFHSWVAWRTRNDHARIFGFTTVEDAMAFADKYQDADPIRMWGTEN